eukprot:NODE_16138_length_1010_cov_3.978482.p1 GENE.NODE_16138_length_1010_cov_3.978482~~NODE_16138_length_1010_cov_3.978482.p1  ORF type:complete len:209 (-),score=34.46 NODE_16138_length_1010_cov_3.978482:198-824(-)
MHLCCCCAASTSSTLELVEAHSSKTGVCQHGTVPVMEAWPEETAPSEDQDEVVASAASATACDAPPAVSRIRLKEDRTSTPSTAPSDAEGAVVASAASATACDAAPFIKLKDDEYDQFVFDVQLAKSTAADRLGIEVMNKPGALHLVVTKIYPGLVTAWNNSQPEARIQLNDYLVAVNGVSGDPGAMLDCMAKDLTQSIKILRRTPLS